VQRRPWRCRSLLTFFGLSEQYSQGVYEEFFNLKYYGGWSFFEVYNLPTVLRRWFLKRLVEQKEKEQKAHEDAMKKAKSGRR